MLKSLSAKLNVTVVCVTTLILAAAGAWNTHNLHQQEIQRLESDASAMLQRLNATLPQTLWDFAPPQAEKILNGEQHPSLLGIRVTDTEGKVFAHSGINNNADAVPREEALERTLSLTFNDGGTLNNVGTLTLYLTDAPIQARVKDAVITRFIEIIVLDIMLS